ncbi:major facilitator superfamily domain-containing protein [Umbelopsis sp. AD052]|nr:major facilitator superfamily domain-containing protein [Umbelopsis sp. AD052]
MLSSTENSTNGSATSSPNMSRKNSLATLSCNSPDKAYIKPESGQHISMKDMMVGKEGISDSDEDTLADESAMSIVEKNEEAEPYCIFSQRKKWAIVMMAAVATFISPLTANIFLPAMNSMQESLNVSITEIKLGVTVYMIFQAISPSFWGAISDVWGRRPVYLSTLLVYVGACVGLAMTQSYPVLLVWRMIQAFGSSSVVAIGAGTIADICTPYERGGYMGYYSLGTTSGPVLGPVIGGIISQSLGWRWIFWVLAMLGGALIIVLFLFLNETLRSLVGNGSGYANPTPYQWLKRRRDGRRSGPQEHAQVRPPEAKRKSLNPFQSLLYLREKDVAILVLYYAFQYGGIYCFTTSVPVIFSEIYGLNDMQIGLTYLANGIGCVFGSVVQGKLLDRNFQTIAIKHGIDPAKLKGGKLTPEFPLEYARLRLAWIHALVFNITLVIYGWCLYVKAHLAIILVLHFILGVTGVANTNSIQTLMVDMFPGRSASIMASNNLIRCLFGAGATVLIDPALEALGVGWGFTVVSLALLPSRFLVLPLLKWGPTWRQQRMEKWQAEAAANGK